MMITDEQIKNAKEYPMGRLFNNRSMQEGRSVKIKCPLHADKNPSFQVYPDNSWYCFAGCGGGDVIEFVKKYCNLSFIEAVEYLNEK